MNGQDARVTIPSKAQKGSSGYDKGFKTGEQSSNDPGSEETGKLFDVAAIFGNIRAYIATILACMGMQDAEVPICYLEPKNS